MLNKGRIVTDDWPSITLIKVSEILCERLLLCSDGKPATAGICESQRRRIKRGIIKHGFNMQHC